MAKRFTATTFHNYLLSAYCVLAFSPAARLERYNNNTGGYVLGAVGYRGLCLFGLASSLYPIIQHRV